MTIILKITQPKTPPQLKEEEFVNPFISDFLDGGSVCEESRTLVVMHRRFHK
jgi:hypothetical protein